MITDEELVGEIKKRLGITGDYHDALLLAYANDTKEYMHSAGIPGDIVDSEASVGIISRGVADLWNLGSGNGVFSGVFFQRITQMALTTWGITDASTGTTATGFSALTTDDLDDCLECLFVDGNSSGSGNSGSSGSGSSGSGSTGSGSTTTGTNFVPMTDEEIDSCTDCLKD